MSILIKLCALTGYVMKYLFKRDYFIRPVTALEHEPPTPIRLAGIRGFWRPTLAFSAQQTHPNFMWWRAPLWFINCLIACVSGCYLIYHAVQFVDFGQELTNVSVVVYRVGERCTSQYTPAHIASKTDMYNCPLDLFACRTYNTTIPRYGTYETCRQSTSDVLTYVAGNFFAIIWLGLKVLAALYYFPHFGKFPKFYQPNRDVIVALKQSFREIVVKSDGKVAVGHSHPLAAIDRNVADSGINTFITLHGLDVYSVQMSQRDIAANLDGSLIHYHLQDQHTAERSDKLTDNHVIKLCNVDYYINWLDYLWMCKPFMLFTFTPEVPCGSHHEYKWTTDSNNFITMVVSGGATYQHQLWNYSVDHFSVNYPGVTITYSVEVNRIYKHWSYVLLTPMAVTKGPFYQRPSMTLVRQRLIVNATTVATIKQHKKSLLFDRGPAQEPCAIIEHPDGSMSVGRPGETSSIRISSELRSVLNSRIQYDEFKFSDLSNLLSTEYGAQQRFAAATLYVSYPYNGRIIGSSTQKYSERDLDVSYGISDPAFLPEKSLTGTVLCPPVLDNGFLPWRSKLNEQWTRTERIENIRNVQVQFLPKYLNYATEFAKLLVPAPHQISPIEISRVMELQNRPTQVQNNLRAERNMDNWIIDMPTEVKSFQKSEVYAGLKDPRNISTLPSEHCLVYSTYTLPFTDMLKQQPWYIFGKHPNRVAEMVHDLCSRSRTVTETDFSRFDGTHSLALYKLELALYLRSFPPCHHKQIRQVHRAMVSAGARMTLGTKYSIGGSRLSGSADTSCMNSIDNAFVSYCAYRSMGYSTVEAYSKLGLYGGDDGLSGDVDAKILERVASDLGLRLKVISRPSNEPTSLLGRVFPIPAGSPMNMADLPRQLAKLHVCPTRDPLIVADPWIGLFNKASGYYQTDPRTPILGEWCSTVLRLTPYTSQMTRNDLRSWASTVYDNLDAYTPDRDIAVAEASRVLNCTSKEIEDYENHLRSMTTCDEFMKLLPFKPRTLIVPDNVQVGDVVGFLVGDSKRESIPVPVMDVDKTVDIIATAIPVIPNRALSVQVPVTPPVTPATTPSSTPCVCKDCSGTFVLPPREVEFFIRKGLKQPKRCKKCAKLKKEKKPGSSPRVT